jgi:putative transposase
MRQYRRMPGQANVKADDATTWALPWPMEEVVRRAREDLESFATQIGLTIIRQVMEAEIEEKAGRWGQQPVHRHGQQPGYVIFGGRKVRLERPRLRSREDKEVALDSYAAFQQNGKLQQAVERQLIRQCSSRDYEGAIDSCLKGYGIKRSSVSRHWKAATAQQLQQLLQRPVPKELLVLMIDSKFFAGQCVAAAVGIDLEGQKHVLGLWHGATENATVVKALLEDLVSRGLDSERKMLIVIDGAKALRKAVKMIFGEQALVQRCRLHKMRNVLDHLPQDQQPQARWRLQRAWAQKDPKVAEQQLRKVARWLEDSWPMAAASLNEGLEETLTVQHLKLQRELARVFCSTNIIENCFAQVSYRTQRVKRWQSPQMILRWAATTLLWAERHFRRIKGCEHLHALEKSLRELHSDTTLKAA